jgi:hypothetical protein
MTPSIEAVNVSPTSRKPEIVGWPIAGLLPPAATAAAQVSKPRHTV